LLPRPCIDGTLRLLPTPASRNFAARRGTGPRADENRPFVEFKEDWFMSCLNAVRPRFEGLLRQTVLVIRAHPQIAQTVHAYAECRYSVKAYARQLHIHPKGGRYRLDRWRTLTGWNVETFNGLMASIIA
jgi:sugar diacid utilization regulator